MLTKKSRAKIRQALEHLDKAEELLNEAFLTDTAKITGIEAKIFKEIGEHLEKLKSKAEAMAG